MLLALIIASTLAGGVVSVLLAALLAYRVFGAWINQLVSFAVGVMLGAAFLDILPEAARSNVPVPHLLSTVLGGIITFFLLEKLALWRHAHVALEDDQHAHPHPHPAGMMILVGDGLHNFVDGILIAAAFLTDIKLGLITSAAVIAHEIPQELGDFVVLLRSGYSKRAALILNSISGLASVVGGVLGYFALSHGEAFIPYVLAVAAASFIYIAIADLIPGLHEHVGGRALVYQPVLMLAGIALVVLQHLLLDA